MRLVLAVLLLAACPAAHSGYPTKSCHFSADCYQGETCVGGSDSVTGTCEPDEGDGGTP
jgi:hypothetical protein